MRARALSQIHTSTGPILIVVKPFKAMPLYTDEVMTQYRLRGEQVGNTNSMVHRWFQSVCHRRFRRDGDQAEVQAARHPLQICPWGWENTPESSSMFKAPEIFNGSPVQARFTAPEASRGR